ncbi:MAG TPA: FHA domain-containing protein [Gemmataceae bacterium]|nr:FHA domain-containing protein [Gemmataceae bacterium]
MPAHLVALTEGPSIVLDKPIMLVGRHPECDIQIDSRKISRKHCCIGQVGDHLIVRDLGSTNGIRINGVRVLEGRLKKGDELTVGGHRYQVSWEMNPDGPGREARGFAARRDPDHAAEPSAARQDAMLESCDEPIPLAEPIGVPRAVAGRKAELPHAAASKARDKGLDGALPHHLDRSPPRIIPEKLHLAPSSDLDLPTPRPSP